MQALGSAIVDWLRAEGNPHPSFVVGRDTRRSGLVFEAAFCAGVCASGGHVTQAGILPTPGVAWLTKSMNATLGVVLSASHNPFQDNGIKLFGSDGYKLTDQQELTIEELLDKHLAGEASYPAADQIGTMQFDHEAGRRYLEHIKSHWPDALSLQQTKIVVDCAHGAASELGPALFAELGADVVALNNTPDGLNINENAGSLHPENLQQLVREHNAIAGLAFDGDADRLIVVDEQGEIVDGDQIMAITAMRLHKQQKLPQATVVATVMSNLGMERTLAKEGITLERTKVGDKYVIQRMRELGAAIGGEQSGHLIFADYGTTGDGMAAALQLLRVLKEEDTPLSTLANKVERYPQILKNVKVREKQPWQEIPEIRDAIAKAEELLGEEGRVFVRYSGTENKARVMVEGADSTLIHTIADDIAALFQSVLGLDNA
jgi:phosphoglucosamine mutase